MTASNWMYRLKDRWNLKSIWQVVIVLVVFACTGTTVLLIKPLFKEWLFGSVSATPLWFSILYWILILPVYNLFLLFYGFVFGHFRFFWEFEKRFFRRIFSRGKK